MDEDFAQNEAAEQPEAVYRQDEEAKGEVEAAAAAAAAAAAPEAANEAVATSNPNRDPSAGDDAEGGVHVERGRRNDEGHHGMKGGNSDNDLAAQLAVLREVNADLRSQLAEFSMALDKALAMRKMPARLLPPTAPLVAATPAFVPHLPKPRAKAVEKLSALPDAAANAELVATSVARAQSERDVARMECNNLAASIKRYRKEGERLRARLEALDGGRLGELENKMGEKDVRIRELEKELRRLTEVTKREDHRSLAKENERLEAEVASSKQELDAQKRLNATLHKASTAAERSQLSMVEELRRAKTEGAKLRSLVAEVDAKGHKQRYKQMKQQLQTALAELAITKKQLEHSGKLHDRAKRRWKAATKELHADYAASQMELKLKRQELLDKDKEHRMTMVELRDAKRPVFRSVNPPPPPLENHRRHPASCSVAVAAAPAYSAYARQALADAEKPIRAGADLIRQRRRDDADPPKSNGDGGCGGGGMFLTMPPMDHQEEAAATTTMAIEEAAAASAQRAAREQEEQELETYHPADGELAEVEAAALVRIDPTEEECDVALPDELPEAEEKAPAANADADDGEETTATAVDAAEGGVTPPDELPEVGTAEQEEHATEVGLGESSAAAVQAEDKQGAWQGEEEAEVETAELKLLGGNTQSRARIRLGSAAPEPPRPSQV